MSRVMVFGTFDGLHPGHLNFFKQANKFGKSLIIIIARDKNVLAIKGHLPKYSEKERLKAVKKLFEEIESTKVSFGQLKNPYSVIDKFRPKTICLGYDQKVFVKKLKEKYRSIEIIRLRPYRSKIYKSSLINSKL